METQASMHVVEQCNQDSPFVVMLMEHVLATLKKENPDINRALNVWTFLIPREEKDLAIDLLQP